MDNSATDPRAPKSVADMVGAANWQRLATMITKPDAPHLLLVGGAGTGKSCAIRLILQDSISLWLRCTQDSNLRDNRELIKRIAQLHAESGTLNWIVLEHADALHADAQAFLRRILETTTGSTRFLLEVRSASPITEPILSRTVLFNVAPCLPFEILSEVKNRSGVSESELFAKIAEDCQGNIRWAIQQGLSLASRDQQYNSLIDPVFTKAPTTWAEIRDILRLVQLTGSSPRAVAAQLVGGVVSPEEWDRSGGACPWTLLTLALSRGLKVDP